MPPSALAWLQGHILAAGCDKRVVLYNSHGKILRTFDYSREIDEYEFTIAAASPSGQVGKNLTVVFIRVASKDALCILHVHVQLHYICAICLYQYFL